MDGANNSSQSSSHVECSDKPRERGRRKINRRRIENQEESRNAKMTNKIEQPANLAAGEGSAAPLTEKEIIRLKGLLEEKMARSHIRGRWAGMVEDCEIILRHLEK